MTSIVLYTDEPMSELGWKAAVREAGSFELFAAHNPEELIRTAPHADIALIELTREITQATLQALLTAAPKCKAVVLTRLWDPLLSVVLNDLGIFGVLQKNFPVNFQLDCLRQAAAGQPWPVADQALTALEAEVAGLLRRGCDYRRISHRLDIDRKRIGPIIGGIIRKLGTGNRARLYRLLDNSVTLREQLFNGLPRGSLLDRRVKIRYEINWEAAYRWLPVINPENNGGFMPAQVKNICSAGMLLNVGKPIRQKQNMEISINWPVMLLDETPIKLMVWGKVLRSEGGDIAVSMERYEFRTRRT